MGRESFSVTRCAMRRMLLWPMSLCLIGLPAMSRLQALLFGLLIVVCQPVSVSADDAPLAAVLAAVPRTVVALTGSQTQELRQAAQHLEGWAADQRWPAEGFDPDGVVALVRSVVEVKQQVDQALDGVLAWRGEFARLPANAQRREGIQRYLQTTSTLIDLSGRLRYLLRDRIDAAALDLDPHPEQFHQLLKLFTDKRVAMAAVAMAYMLFDPPPESGVQPFPPEDRLLALQLIAAARPAESLPDLATYVRTEQQPDLVVYAADIIRYLGLPQKPRPETDPTVPAPVILAEDLQQILTKIDEARLTPPMVERRRTLLGWLQQRSERGVLGERYRIGNFEVRAGDWLLMRNPSPYNMFTDLAPGLFTHVGVVAVETGADDIRRFVVVDLPERGATVPATNVEAYLLRTLHCFFLRDDDPTVGARLGQAAADMIGNPTQFDLTFRTSRVLAVKGQPLKGATIHTYCAGFLLLCAQTTPAPREAFFPFSETPARGNTLQNLATLGMTIGDEFVSPTGAVFSPRMQIAGRREPMYHPGREIQEAIYDHFADDMLRKVLKPSPDAYQALRQKLAELAASHRWLARAIAQASDVSEKMDLEAAAKVAAVIETLDEIANANRDEFLAAQRAITAGPESPQSRDRPGRDDPAPQTDYRQRHADLVRAWDGGQLSPRELRLQLVKFYADRGRRQLDERFFR